VRSRADSKLETRQRLIEAGIELIAERGLDGPSLDAICERAGYTRGAFYVHFADRDDFIQAVMDQVGVAFLDAVITTGQGEGPGGLEETMQRFLAAMAAGAYPLTSERGIRPHQLLDACARSPQIRARYVELVRLAIARVGAAVSADQRRGALRPDVEAGEVATVLLAGVIGLQTMLELGMQLDAARAAGLFSALLRPAAALRRGSRRS
jgi:AcrR family transcriptional regulator